MKMNRILRARLGGLGAVLAGLGYAGIAHGQSGQMIFGPPVVTNNSVILKWTGGGVLQTAPAVTGPWSTVVTNVDAQSSAQIPLESGARFARAVQLGTPSDPVALLPAPPGNPFSPLEIQSASVVRLAQPNFAGNAVLQMKVGTNQPPGTNRFQLLTDETTLTTFRDDGVFPDTKASDLTFSAVVNVDTEELQSANARLANILPERRFNLTVDRLTKRVLATNTIAPFDVTNFLAGQPLRVLDPLIKMPCDGIAGAYDWRKTIMITDLSVVQDPVRTWDPCPVPGGTGNAAGVWSFGFLMEEICNQPVTGINPSDFVKSWLESYDTPHPINTDLVPANPAVRDLILNRWLEASRLAGKPSGVLDLRRAPFRLLAIVNRVDLRGNPAYGSPTVLNPSDPPCIGGESRFVFCATDANCNPLPFLVILEYCNPVNTCSEIRNWGKMWADLNSFSSFNSSYRAALQAITDRFSRRDAIPARAPNHSALNQLRVNEILGGGQWRLTEYKLVATGSEAGQLRPATVANTPDFDLNNTATINAVCPLPSVPLFLGGAHVLGGWAPVGAPWNGNPAMPFPTRHNWAMRTCNGCHGSETPANPFTHVGMRNQGDTAELSEFLTGRAVWPDPITGGNVGPFRELDDRVQKLDQLVNCPCGFFGVFFRPVLAIDPRLLVNPRIGNLGGFVH